MRPVITGEEDDGVIIKPVLFQLVHDPANIGIHPGNHCGLVLFRLGPGLVVVGHIRRHLHAVSGAAGFLVVRVRYGVGKEEEKRPVAVQTFRLVHSDEIQSGGGEHVRHVDLLLASTVLREFRLPLIARLRIHAPEIVGVVVMGVSLVQVTDEVIESLALRHPGAVRFAEAPFAYEGGQVPGILQHLGQGTVLGAERQVGIAANPGVAGMLTSHERGARGSAHGTARVELGEADAFGSQLVDVRRLELRLTIASEVAIPQIVCHNEYDVWLSGSGRGRGNNRGTFLGCEQARFGAEQQST